MQTLLRLPLILLLALGLSACGGTSSDQGDKAGSQDGASGTVTAADIGPVQNVDLGPIEDELAKQGEELFNIRCKTCHKLDEQYIGPALRNITEQRDPVYIMNMILAPEEMLQKHPTAKQLLAEYGTMMTNQNLSEEQARALLEYLRTVAEEPSATANTP